jgi:hypothetical protein
MGPICLELVIQFGDLDLFREMDVTNMHISYNNRDRWKINTRIERKTESDR